MGRGVGRRREVEGGRGRRETVERGSRGERKERGSRVEEGVRREKGGGRRGKGGSGMWSEVDEVFGVGGGSRDGGEAVLGRRCRAVVLVVESDLEADVRRW